MNTYILEDNLLISSPGVGGLTYLEGRNQVTISTKASTGIYIGKEGLFCGLQENGGNHLILAKDGASDDIELAKDALDIHDVLVHENLIYFVATQTNAVVCLNSDFKIVDSWQLSGEEDSSHINSVAVYKGRLIASAFGNFKLHREYKNGTQGLGRVFDVRTGETLIEGLSQPHSLTVENNYLYLCSSEENTLHVYKDQTLIKSVLIPGYARGVAVGEDYIYVGISLSRNVNSDISKLTSGAIAVIDKKSMIIVGLNMLPFREVYDIRIVNQHSNIFSIFQTTQLEIKALKLNLESSKSEIEDLSKAVQDREQILKNIMASMSWKLTKPLRIIKAIILSAYK